MSRITIIGAGLAGSEAALQLSAAGHTVTLYDSKPKVLIEAYKSPTFAELVCNNSLGAVDVQSALGMLLHELKNYGSKVLKIAEDCRVNDPTFFAVDKQTFSRKVTQAIHNAGIRTEEETVTELPDSDYVLVATGPLTNDSLLDSIATRYGMSSYHFSDASSPIIDITSLNLDDRCILKVTDDLYVVSIPEELFGGIKAELTQEYNRMTTKDEEEKFSFSKCMAIERLAALEDNLLQKTRMSSCYSKEPSILLRRENALENGFIMVGCMTTMRHRAQKRVFSMLPGFERCEFIKYGRMHRNSFFDTPGHLSPFFQIRNSNTFIIGQLSGIDGYAPAIASGLVAAKKIIDGENCKLFSPKTMVGALARYVSNTQTVEYQPMPATLALLST